MRDALRPRITAPQSCRHGILANLIANPSGLMLALLMLGIVVVVLAMRRLEDALDPRYAEPV